MSNRSRLSTLLRRIDTWEGNEEPKGTKETIWALEEATELLLDIKQCLESVLETLEP